MYRYMNMVCVEFEDSAVNWIEQGVLLSPSTPSSDKNHNSPEKCFLEQYTKDK